VFSYSKKRKNKSKNTFAYNLENILKNGSKFENIKSMFLAFSKEVKPH